VTLTVRQRYTHAPLTDVIIVDNLGRKIAYSANTFGSTESDAFLRSVIDKTGVDEGVPGASAATLPATLPFALG
jgi:hypothetical protein